MGLSLSLLRTWRQSPTHFNITHHRELSLLYHWYFFVQLRILQTIQTAVGLLATGILIDDYDVSSLLTFWQGGAV
jgi:hypothetical protein